MAAPVSNGAIVEDETAGLSVAVNFNFSNTGSGGTLQVFQSATYYAPYSGLPDDNDPGWTAAADAAGNAPSDGVQSTTFSHVGFTQARGTLMYYYSRRKSASAVEIGTPWPVTEIVPSRAYISGVSYNAGYSVATVNTSVADTVTTLYYYASTSSTQPGYALTNAAQTSPSTIWSTNNSFTVTPGSNYYYWVLGWTHNNPGPDGAVISPMFAATAGAGSMGLRVFTDATPPLIRLDTKDKQIMHYAAFSGSLAKNGTATISVGGGYDITSGDWGIDVTPVDLYLKAVSTTNQIVVSYPRPGTVPNPVQWRINVFKLNQA